MKLSAGILVGMSVFLGSLCAAPLGAQAGGAPKVQGPGPTATITFVQGSDLSIIRGGAPLTLADPLGFELGEGDQIQTGAKTQVELLLMPRDARVKLAENSVLTISKLGQTGASGLALLYGRLRSKVAVLATAAPDFSVQAGAVSAGVRGTDFGCDLVVPRSGSLDTAPVLVYCFEGTVAVSQNAPAASANGAPPPVLVTAGTMARVEIPAPGAAPTISTEALAPDIQRFWSANDFAPATTAAAAPGSAATTQAQAASSQPAASVLPAEELAAFRKMNSRKNSVIGGGLAFTALSAALEGASAILRPSNSNLADMLALGGLVCAATGVPVLVVAITVDPFSPSP